jgi:Uma2 family endonuclease
MSTATPTARRIEYPDSDGQPMAESTLQYEWIVALHANLEVMFRDREDVFVAADNLIYPVEGQPTVRAAPDVYVAVGRPKGHRGSYQVWREGGIFPQVVFEVLSPGNRAGAMGRKFVFYEQYGTEEYYIIDPFRNQMEGYVREADGLVDVPDMNGHVSPRLGIRFTTSADEPILYRPDGRRFLNYLEVTSAPDRADAEQQRADAEQQRADAEQQRANALAAELERTKAILRTAGIDPDALG